MFEISLLDTCQFLSDLGSFRINQVGLPPSYKQSSSEIRLQITRTERLQWCLTLFDSGCFGLRRWVALKRQKSCTNSEQPPIYTCPTIRFQTHAVAWLGLQAKLTHPSLDKVCSHCLCSKNRIWLSIISVTLTLFTLTHLTVRWFL